ncbi:NUDIX domain-containing protein [Embleya sp. NPDC008237]|uniref:NUDIX domain-containing protein n=1 Tax=Embleya sp. NPDC008237 TaxID=3363978 RepID=UPI0036F19214
MHEEVSFEPQQMVMLVASVIVHDLTNGRVVLLRRGEGKAFAPGMWSLPGGKGLRGEPVTHTAVRELREETGLVVEPQALRLAHVTHSAHSPEAPEGFVVLVFAAEAWHGEPVNAEPGNHSAVAWVDTPDLPTDFVPSTLHALERYLAGERPEVAIDGWDGA